MQIGVCLYSGSWLLGSCLLACLFVFLFLKYKKSQGQLQPTLAIFGPPLFQSIGMVIAWMQAYFILLPLLSKSG